MFSVNVRAKSSCDILKSVGTSREIGIFSAQYGLVVMTKISTEINTIASPYDNKKTMNYCLVVLIFSWLTMGIVPLVWAHRFSNRVGSELLRRNLPYQFDAGTFWLWNVLGSLIVVGPFVYTHKLLTAMNMLCTDYNAKG